MQVMCLKTLTGKYIDNYCMIEMAGLLEKAVVSELEKQITLTGKHVDHNHMVSWRDAHKKIQARFMT